MAVGTRSTSRARSSACRFPRLVALWMQRKRWARGQGEVLHVHFGEVIRWRNHRMWLLLFEGLVSVVWIVALSCLY